MDIYSCISIRRNARRQYVNSRMLNDFLKYIDDEQSLCYLWHNIQNSNCKLCKKVYKKTVLNANLVLSIIETYSEESLILSYIFQNFVYSYELSSLKLVVQYINLYYDIVDKMKRIMMYPIFIFTCLIVISYGIQAFIDISIGYVVYIVIFGILSSFLLYIIIKIYRKLKYIILLTIVISFIENTINLQNFIQTYSKLMKHKPQLQITDSAASLTRLLVGVEFLSIAHGNDIRNNHIIKFNEYINGIPNTFFNILIFIVGIFIFNLMYAILQNMMNFI